MSKPMISEDDFKLSDSLGKIKHVIIVMSGKGGVGKSTVSSNIAVELNQKGYETGLMDIDITGPNIPKMFGIEDEQLEVRNERLIPVIVPPSLKVMSMAFLLPSKDSPVIWRGPVKMSAIRQFIEDVEWGKLDYLVVDMPPGTGDIQLTLSQTVPVTGAIVVTTPQDIALLDAKKGLRMFQKVNVPILGVVENMSIFVCPECGHAEHIFGEGGAKRLSDTYHVDVLGQLPLDAKIREEADSGAPTVVSSPESMAGKIYREIALKAAAAIAKTAKDMSLKMPSVRVENN